MDIHDTVARYAHAWVDLQEAGLSPRRAGQLLGFDLAAEHLGLVPGMGNPLREGIGQPEHEWAARYASSLKGLVRGTGGSLGPNGMPLVQAMAMLGYPLDAEERAKLDKLIGGASRR